jgi:ubiquinone/menaquinone biosynthesis C-methylase UbiE
MLPTLSNVAYALPANGSVLDVGCGDGSASGTWLKSTGRTYLGLDVSPTAIESARSRGLDAELIEDATSLPIEDSSYDAVVCTEVLEHLFLPNVAAAEMYRVLKPRGVLVATTPNVAYWRRCYEMLRGSFNPFGDELSWSQPWRDPHIRFFKAVTLENMLREAGFNDVLIGGHGGAIDKLAPLRGGNWHLVVKPGLIRKVHDRLAPYLGCFLHTVAHK